MEDLLEEDELFLRFHHVQNERLNIRNHEFESRRGILLDCNYLEQQLNSHEYDVALDYFLSFARSKQIENEDIVKNIVIGIRTLSFIHALQNDGTDIRRKLEELRKCNSWGVLLTSYKSKPQELVKVIQENLKTVSARFQQSQQHPVDTAAFAGQLRKRIGEKRKRTEEEEKGKTKEEDEDDDSGVNRKKQKIDHPGLHKDKPIDISSGKDLRIPGMNEGFVTRYIFIQSNCSDKCLLVSNDSFRVMFINGSTNGNRTEYYSQKVKFTRNASQNTIAIQYNLDGDRRDNVWMVYVTDETQEYLMRVQVNTNNTLKIERLLSQRRNPNQIFIKSIPDNPTLLFKCDANGSFRIYEFQQRNFDYVLGGKYVNTKIDENIENTVKNCRTKLTSIEVFQGQSNSTTTGSHMFIIVNLFANGRIIISNFYGREKLNCVNSVVKSISRKGQIGGELDHYEGRLHLFGNTDSKVGLAMIGEYVYIISDIGEDTILMAPARCFYSCIIQQNMNRSGLLYFYEDDRMLRMTRIREEFTETRHYRMMGNANMKVRCVTFDHSERRLIVGWVHEENPSVEVFNTYVMNVVDD